VFAQLINNLRRKKQHHGLSNTIYALALKAINAAFGVKVLRGVRIENPEASFLQCPAAYRAGFLSASQLRAYARDPKSEISEAFLAQALSRGDQCYAICDGDTLAAYGWYSFGSTPIGLSDLVLKFSPEYVYMYKGFTDTRYRGQRLHAIGMTRALQHYRNCGYKGLVSYVEAQNFDSLKSCFRMGYAVFGSIGLSSVLGRYYAFASPGCKRFHFRLEHTQRSVANLTFGKS
jgi:hypothetical protein